MKLVKFMMLLRLMTTQIDRSEFQFNVVVKVYTVDEVYEAKG